MPRHAAQPAHPGADANLFGERLEFLLLRAGADQRQAPVAPQASARPDQQVGTAFRDQAPDEPDIEAGPGGTRPPLDWHADAMKGNDCVGNGGSVAEQQVAREAIDADEPASRAK